MNRLNPQTLKAYAHQLALRANLRIGLLLMAVFTVFLSFSIFLKYDFLMRKSVESQSNNFAYWLQVNDIFQIQRSLAELVEFQDLNAAQVVDRFGKRVGVYPFDAESRFTAIDQDGLKVVGKSIGFLWSFPLFEGGQAHRERLGTLTILVPIPVLEILLVTLVFVCLLMIILRWIRSAMMNLAKEATDPISFLSAKVESATSLADLEEKQFSQTSFREISVLEKRLTEMASRIIENERVVRQVEQAQELFRVSSQVAHDIRSPVMALRIVAASSQDLPTENKDLILSAADRVEKIATDLLNRHKTEAARKQTLEDGFNVSQSCTRILNEQKVLLNKPGVELKVTMESEDLTSRVGTAYLFERVFSNVINNAIEAISDSGSVAIVVGRRQNEAVITVTDSGPGIDPDIVQKIKSGPVQSTKENGTGLGLYGSIKTISSWNGRFDIKSSAGQGTTIEIGLPI